MNVERNTANICQDKKTKDVLRKLHPEVVLTPTRRSSRINKPRATDDKQNDTSRNRGLSEEKFTKHSNSDFSTGHSSTVNPISSSACDSDRPNSNKDVETNSAFFHTDSGEEQSFAAMFEQRYSKTLESLLPTKLNTGSLKQKQFFKRNSLESPKLNFSNYMCNKNNLPVEDVSKVFKIISKPSVLSDLIIDSKSYGKSPLKTYSNKRKNVKKTDIIESFGLPDCPIAPIVSENVPIETDSELDVSIQDMNDITILDMECINEPWIIKAEESESLFTVLEEVRSKSEPINHELFKKNGSFLDFADTFENLMEPTLFTSMPFGSCISEKDVCTTLNSTNTDTKIDNKSKEINIELLKRNFKKMLSRSHVVELQEQGRELIKEKKMNPSPKKKCMVTKISNVSSVNSGILIVEDNSLTVENKEFEFANPLLVPTPNSIVKLLEKSETLSEHNSIGSKKKVKTNVKNFRHSLKIKRSTKHLKKNKNLVRTSPRKKQTSTANESKKKKVVNLPKNTSETDNLISNSRCHSLISDVAEKSLDHQNSVTSVNENDKIHVNNKRLLRSSLNNSPKNPKTIDVKNCSTIDKVSESSTNNVIHENANKKLGECKIREKSHSNITINKETEKPLKKNPRSSICLVAQIKPERNTTSSQKKTLGTKTSVPNKRPLRSRKQNSIEREEKSLDLCNSNTEMSSPEKNKLLYTSDVKITLEKCNFINNFEGVVTDNSLIKTSNNEIPQKSKCKQQILSPLMKGKKTLPEIQILLNPLDISKLNSKLRETAKKSFSEILSPTKRKLRSTKATSDCITFDRNEDLLHESNKQDKKFKEKNKNRCNKVIVASSFKKNSPIKEPVITEKPVDAVEGEKNIKIEESIIKISQQTIRDVRKGEDLKTNQDESENGEINNIDNLCNDEVTASNVELDDLLIIGTIDTVDKSAEICHLNDSIAATNLAIVINEENYLCNSLICNSDLDQKNILVEHSLEGNKDLIEDPSSLGVESIQHVSSIDDFSTVADCYDSSKYIIFEDVEPLQVEVKTSNSPGETESKDESVLSEEKISDEINLELGCDYTSIDVGNMDEQMETKDLSNITDNNQIVFTLKNVKNDKQDSVLESLPDLLKTEEKKTIFSIPVMDKIDSTKYLKNQSKMLDGTIQFQQQKVVTDISEDSNIGFDSKNISIISDTLKSDVINELSSAFFDESYQRDKETNDAQILDSSKIQIIIEKEPFHNEEKNVVNELKKLDIIQQSTQDSTEIVEILNSEENATSPQPSPSNIISTEPQNNTEIVETVNSEENINLPINIVHIETVLVANELNIEQENNLFSNLVININTEDMVVQNSLIENDSLGKNRNEVDGKLKKGCNARLNEKRKKLLGIKAVSHEESLLKHSCATQKTKCNESLTSDNFETDTEISPVLIDEKHSAVTEKCSQPGKEPFKNSENESANRLTQVSPSDINILAKSAVNKSLTRSSPNEGKQKKPKQADIREECNNQSDEESLKRNEKISSNEFTQIRNSKEKCILKKDEDTISSTPTLLIENKLETQKGFGTSEKSDDQFLQKNKSGSVAEVIQITKSAEKPLPDKSTDVSLPMLSSKKRGRPRRSDTSQRCHNQSIEKSLTKNDSESANETPQIKCAKKIFSDQATIVDVPKESKQGETKPFNIPENSIIQSAEKLLNINRNGLVDGPKQKTNDSEQLMSAIQAATTPLQYKRKRGRPRRSELPEKFNDQHTDNKLRGRPRRKSLDDMNLLNRYKEYFRDKTKRSKSVARNMLEITRKPNSRDDFESSRNWIGSQTRLNDCRDDAEVDFFSQCNRQSHNTRRSKSVAPNFLETSKEVIEHDKLKSSIRSHSKRNSLDDMNLLNRYKEYFKDKTKGRKSDFTTEVGNESSVTIANLKAGKIFRKDTGKDDRDFKVGDIAWAQIGSHPFWPCLITKEPGTRSYKRIFQGKRFQRTLYHVRFFGDKGRRAWIKTQQIMLYSSRNDLDLLKDKMKSENKPIPAAYITRRNKYLEKWECAVEEAEQLKLKNIKEKLSFFVNMFSENNLPKQKISSPDNISKKTISLKRKLNERDDIEIKCELLQNKENDCEKTPTPKRSKRSSVKEEKVIEETPPNKLPEHIEDTRPIHNIETNIPTELNASGRQNDETSEIESKTSSDSIDASLNSMETQKALYKRNNLFRGISRDKVCQYCCKPGEVLKCRGRCNGSYHITCSVKILYQATSKKRRDKNSTNNLKHDIKFEALKNKSFIKFNSDDNPENLILDTKILHLREDANFCKNEINISSLSEEDQVQIITVPSSVYNTPPRKTFPPDFKNMSLAEQIDYKMKEIMKKFESKPSYTESSSERNSQSSSEENSVTRSSQSVLKSPLDSPSTNINKKSEESIQETKPNKCANNEINSVLNNIEELTVAKKIDPNKCTNDGINNVLNNIEESAVAKKIGPHKVKPIIKKKLFIKHITADCEVSKNDVTLEDEKLNTDDESCDGAKPVDPKNFKCGFCISDLYPYCFICHLAVSKKGSNIRQKCSIYYCGKFYHPECLKMWPQTQWSLIQTTKHKDSDKDMDSFVCPLHVCHTCVSDDPRAATSRCSGDKIVKCLRCPSTYHSSNLCVPAGTVILSSSQIICPRHREKSRLYTINTTWCFLCSEGGNLICCETCPTSVHPECLPVNLTDDDKFICEDCESGRLPLYDEIVWVKLGRFRWWPALILFPNEVPANIRNMKHSIGEFVVKFFGTYDYYWVNRGRSFLFQEGDTGHCNSIRKKVDAAFNTAVEEAVIAHKLKKEFKLSQEVEPVNALKPPPYIKIKVNKPVGSVRHLDLDLSSTNACECDPNKPHPCGPESDCLNRLLMTECNPEVCPAGTRCNNQSFEKREYPPLVPYKTQGRGWGLKTLAPIKKGQFVIEYVGELIDVEEYQRRILKMHEQKEENYYFLTIDKDRMIDAGPKGNAARFMNHCCQPNCETQKWTVNGDTRVGLFATEDIPVDTELTFNYNLECVGKEKKVCRCGAPNCSGFIGVKAKQDGESKKSKKSIKKKKTVEPVILPPCFICGKKGDLISCSNKVCNKTYHQKCLKTSEHLEGNKFICPWHNCNTCSKRTIRCCVKCINSYCPSHSDGNIRYDNLLGFVCTTHDPMTPPNDNQPIRYKRRKNGVITEESAVTSTSDDIDNDEDWMPLSLRLQLLLSKQTASTDLESDNDSIMNKSSTPLKKESFSSDQGSHDESTVSSATLTDVDEEIAIVKRKRGKPRKDQFEKKIRLSNEPNIGNTASSSITDDSFRDLNSSDLLTSSYNDLENR